mgnify:CR=1 FL=1
MQLLLDAYTYFLANQDRFWEALGRHEIELTAGILDGLASLTEGRTPDAASGPDLRVSTRPLAPSLRFAQGAPDRARGAQE